MEADAILSGSNFPPLRQAIARGDSVCAVRLPGFGGLLDHPTQPGVTFAQEIADRVRVIACSRARSLHDPLGGEEGWVERCAVEGIWPGPWERIPEDAIVVVWAPEEDAATAAREVLIRAREALVGIPAETRQAYADGTTGFERILPGPDRMYPDTDTPPLPIPDSTVAEVRAQHGRAPLGPGGALREAGPGRPGGSVCSPWRPGRTCSTRSLPARVTPPAGSRALLEKRIPFHARRHRASKPRTAREIPEAGRLSPAGAGLRGWGDPAGGSGMGPGRAFWQTPRWPADDDPGDDTGRARRTEERLQDVLFEVAGRGPGDGRAARRWLSVGEWERS